MFIKCIILKLFILYIILIYFYTPILSIHIRPYSKFQTNYLNINNLSFIKPINLSIFPNSRISTCLFEKRKYKLKLTAGGKFRIKPKTNHSVAKRFKITATGKLMYRRATTQHKQRHKRRGAKARLHRNGIITSIRMIRKIKSVLHNR